MMKLVPLQEETPERLLSSLPSKHPKIMWVYSKMGAAYKPEERFWNEIYILLAPHICFDRINTYTSKVAWIKKIPIINNNIHCNKNYKSQELRIPFN